MQIHLLLPLRHTHFDFLHSVGFSLQTKGFLHVDTFFFVVTQMLSSAPVLTANVLHLCAFFNLRKDIFTAYLHRLPIFEC